MKYLFLIALFIFSGPAQAFDYIKVLRDGYFSQLQNSQQITLISDRVVSEDQWFKTRHIILEVPKLKDELGQIQIMKRDPVSTTERNFPTSLLAAGAATGMNAVDLLPPTPGFSIAVLDYGIPDDLPQLNQFEIMLKNFWQFQAHYLIALTWLSQQSEVNASRLSTINISFGNFVAPHPLYLQQSKLNLNIHATVFAFGGSSLMPFVEQELAGKISGQDIAKIENAIRPVIKLFEPGDMLPKLKGPFLIVQATDDSVIPEQSIIDLRDNLSEEPTIIQLEGPHIDIGQKEMIANSVARIFQWLSQQPDK